MKFRKLLTVNIMGVIILLGGNQQWRYIMSLPVSKLPKLEVTDYYKNMTMGVVYLSL